MLNVLIMVCLLLLFVFPTSGALIIYLGVLLETGAIIPVIGLLVCLLGSLLYHWRH